MFDQRENWFKVPRQVLSIYPLLDTVQETKTVFYALCHLWAGQSCFWLTFDDFLNGRKSAIGNERVDQGVGIPANELREALNSLLKKGFLHRLPVEHDEVYELNFESDVPDDAWGDNPNSAGKSWTNVPKPKKTTPGYIYVLRGGMLYKIGRSANPKVRFRSLSTVSPVELEVVCLAETHDMVGVETQLHERFADRRQQGEWFALTDDDVNSIRAMLEPSTVGGQS